jgi:hypothetical protein
VIVDAGASGVGGSEGIDIWDLRTRQRVGERFTARHSAVAAIALREVDGMPIDVSGGDENLDGDQHSMRVWHLAPP